MASQELLTEGKARDGRLGGSAGRGEDTLDHSESTRPRDVLPPMPPDDYALLKESIRRHGVLCEVHKAPGGEVLDGRVRLQIVQELRAEGVVLPAPPERVVGGLGPAERIEYRIWVNKDRRHLDPAQKRSLAEVLFRISPTRSTRDVAEAVGVSQSTASRAKRLVVSGEAVSQGDSAPAGCGAGEACIVGSKPSVSCLTPQQAKEAAKLLDEVGDRLSGRVSMRKLRHTAYQARAEALARGPAPDSPPEIRLEHCDFRELERKVGDVSGRVSLALLDPPWGADWYENLPDLAGMTERCLKDGGIALVYVGQGSLPVFIAEFGKVLGWRWLQACENGHLLTPLRAGGNIKSLFRPVMVFSKGKFKCPKHIPDLIRVATADTRWQHAKNWQQPIEEAVLLVEKLTRPGDLVVDLTAGSGTVAEAVIRVGQRSFIGAEIDELNWKIARKRIAEAIGSAGAAAQELRATRPGAPTG